MSMTKTDSMSITDASSAAVERRLSGYSPDVSPPTFATADVSYAVTVTAIGRILLASNDSGALLASRFVPDAVAEESLLIRLGRAVSPRVLRRPAALDEARRQLDDYLGGRRQEFELATDLSLLTPFQRSVLTTLASTVGYGRCSTYGALAASIDRPSAARAVGAALGANPLCVVLPCHRVIGSAGSLTGYAGGTQAKRFLLDLEAAS